FAERVADVVALAGTANTELATLMQQRGDILNLEALLAAPQPPTQQEVQHALTLLEGSGLVLVLANKLPLKEFNQLLTQLAGRLDHIADQTARAAAEDRIALLRLEADLRQHPMDTDEVAGEILTQVRNLLTRATTGTGTNTGGWITFADLEQRVNAGYERYQ